MSVNNNPSTSAPLICFYYVLLGRHATKRTLVVNGRDGNKRGVSEAREEHNVLQVGKLEVLMLPHQAAGCDTMDGSVMSQ